MDMTWVESYQDLSLEEVRRKAAAEGRTLRELSPGMAMTMDLRADRLNASLDQDGALQRVWAG